MLSPIRSACSCLWLRLQHPWRLGPPQLFVCLVTYITHHIASLAGSATHMVAVPTPALLAGAAKFLTTSQRFPHLPPGRASFVQAHQLCTSAPRSNQGALPLRCQHQPRRRPCLSHTAKLPSRHQHWYTHKSTRQIVPTWPGWFCPFPCLVHLHLRNSVLTWPFVAFHQDLGELNVRCVCCRF